MGKHEMAFVTDKGTVITPRGRLVWPNILKAQFVKGTEGQGGKARFSVTLLLPKTANIDVLVSGMTSAGIAELGRDWKKKAKHLPLLKTADNDKLEPYAAEFPLYLKATSAEDYPPKVFGPDPNVVFDGDASEVYGGRWAVIGGKFKGYSKGQSGVGFYFNKVQLLQHADAIASGGVVDAEGFEAVDIDAGSSADAVWGNAA